LGEKKVLITFGSRYGSTVTIAENIAKTLNEKGFDTTSVNLGNTKSKNWPNADDYSGVIIGSGMQMGMWKKEVKSFIKKNKEQLISMKFGFFTCGAEAITEPEKAKERIYQSLKDSFELEPVIWEAFKGVLDLSENSKFGKMSKKMFKMGIVDMQEQAKANGIELNIDPDGMNDYRDWEKIRNFTEEYASNISTND